MHTTVFGRRRFLWILKRNRKTFALLVGNVFWFYPDYYSTRSFLYALSGKDFQISDRAKGAEKASRGEKVVQKGVFGESVSSGLQAF